MKKIIINIGGAICLFLTVSCNSTNLQDSKSKVQLALNKITKIDKVDGGINSVLSINPNAIEDERAQLAKGGLLAGIPILVKDNIETFELATTAGSLALRDNHTKRDAPIVEKLRHEGAVILGKTNLSEWANFRSEDSISGWSSVGGLTRNPHNLSRSACGSSSGSGAAVAAGIVDFAIGTETNGSIICPASMNGIVGFKPTVGLLSAKYIVPISHSQDTAGPMTRTVRQSALMTGIMTEDNYGSIKQSLLDFAKSPNASLRGHRIGVVINRLGNVSAVRAMFKSQLGILEKAGAELVEIEAPDLPEDFWEKSYLVLLTEFKHGINAYLEDSSAELQLKSLEDLIAFNEREARVLGVFDQSIFEKSLATIDLRSDDYLEALTYVQEHTRGLGIDAMLDEHQLSMLVAPSNNPSFLIDGIYGDNAPKGFPGIGYMAAIAGYPHLSVPAGKIKGMPVGLSFITGKYNDSILFNAGQAIENARVQDLSPDFIHKDFADKNLSDLEKNVNRFGHE
ncbi:amidase family protein [Agaribacter flavus]|uniref:Amidase family protein n=1 Tax=Agaribacter flavus TaxID=1902781 RepID=A0ABV7FLY7_9ALTE